MKRGTLKKPSGKNSKDADRGLLGLGWLWSRDSSKGLDDAVDLKTIDAWRKGLLSPGRREEVKRQLANDPRLMRQLEELIAADELIRELDTSEKAYEKNQSLIGSVRKRALEIVEHLKQPAWVGGLSASAAAIVLLVLIIPVTTTQGPYARLNEVYAGLNKPPESLQVPWTPKIVIRGDTTRPDDTPGTKLNDLLALAFQSGMAEGMRRIETRFPDVTLNPGGYVNPAGPECFEGINECEQLTELAKTSGSWAVAAFLECQDQPHNNATQALSLLGSLQQAWRDSVENELSSDILAITVDGNICLAAKSLLRDWGRPTVQMN
jgi:hypothetical protein